MSQRKWTTTDGWDVLTGWDRPLQYFFVTIDRDCQNCGGEGFLTDSTENEGICPVCDGQGNTYLFNNLDDQQYTRADGGMTIEQVAAVLVLKLTAYPDSILADLQSDKLADMGNLIKVYDPIGEAKH